MLESKTQLNSKIHTMILITGATGHLGGTVIDFLLEKLPAKETAVLVRDKGKADKLTGKGVDVRTGDYNNKETLLSAFKEIDKMLLISGNDVAKRLQQHKNAIDAAKQAGVKHVIYTSFDRKKEDGSPLGILAQSHIETDRYLKESGLVWTIIRNTLYADALPMFFGEDVLETGIFFPAGNGKVPFATRRDMAEATAAVLTGEEHGNRDYVFANTHYYSMHDAAVILSDIAGRQVKYHNPPQEVYTEELTKAGVPQESIEMGVAFGEAIKTGEFETDRTDLDKILGREPVSLKDFLKQLYTPG